MTDNSLIDSESMKAFAGRFPTGVAVITAASSTGECLGLTMNSVTSLSVNPPKYIVCVDKQSNTLPAIRERNRFCINFLARDQHDVCKVFASKSGDKGDKIDHYISELGNPLINGAMAHGECVVQAYLDGGDHEIIIGGIENTNVFEKMPLVYYKGQFAGLNL